MKILFDVQGIQGRSGARGIGRYSFEMLKELARQLDGHQIYFLKNNLLEVDNKRISEIEIICPAGTWIEIEYPTDIQDSSSRYALINSIIRDEIITGISPDWVHHCSVVEGFNEHVVKNNPGSFLNTCFFYDAIPAIYPERFLPNDDIADWYWGCTSSFGKYDQIFAISSTASDEGMNYLGIPENKITAVWGGIDSTKFELFDSSDAYDLTYVGSFEERKNIPRLIEAFSLALPKLHGGTKLNLVGKYYDSELETINRVMDSYNISDRVKIHGFLSDIDLNSLMHKTRLLVMPSLHEGLGLPLLEAMALGVPAIASNVSSMKVMLQGLSNTFDPMSAESMSKQMVKYSNDHESRAALIAEFQKRRNEYSWQSAASKIINRVIPLVHERDRNTEFSRSDVRDILRKSIESLSKLDLSELEASSIAGALSANYTNLLSKAVISSASGIARVLSGHFGGTYSLSQLNRNIFSASIGNQMRYLYRPERFDGNKGFQLDSDIINSESMRENFNSLDLGKEKGVLMRNAYPPYANDMNGKINLYHTYNWEETEFPQEYISEFNLFLDGVTFSSSFVQKTLIDNGLSIPSAVVGASVGISEISSNVQRRTPNKSKIYTFLHISSAFPRKGIDLLLDAYGQVFNNSQDVLLVIKTFDNPHNTVSEDIKNFKIKYPKHAPIEWINEEYTSSELTSLYSRADCLIQPSRGEGFGMPAYEALCLGIPVVATNWGGPTDFLDAKNGVLLDYNYVLSNSHLKTQNSMWVEPKMADLINALREMFSKRMHVKFKMRTWQEVLVRQEQFISQISGLSMRNPRIGWISTFNTRCGIAEYSKGLLKHIPESQYRIFPPKSGTPLDMNLEKRFERIWIEKGPLGELQNEILSSNLDALVIEHNWGFYSNHELNKLVLNISKSRNVIIDIHSLRNEDFTPRYEIKEALPAFLNASRVIVHDIKDLNLLKELGVGANMTMIPLPFPNPVTDTNYDFASFDEITIGTSGFALPNKNQELLFEIGSLLLSNFKKVSIRFYCPEHSDPSSAIHVRKLESLIHNNPGLDAIIITDFLTDDELLERLNECSVVVYAYKSTGETASAAVRHGLASGVPVVVTPSPIFDSVEDLVYRSAEYSPKSIASRIVEIHKDFSFGGNAETESARVRKVVQQFSRKNTSMRFHGMIQGIVNMQ